MIAPGLAPADTSSRAEAKAGRGPVNGVTVPGGPGGAT